MGTDWIRALSRKLGAKFVLKPLAGDNFAEVERYTNLGTIIAINSKRLGEVDFSKNAASYDAILSEELLHAAAVNLTTPKEIEDVWRSLSADEQTEVREAYKPKPGDTEYNLGHEYIRMVLQDRIEGRITEQTKPLTVEAKGVLQKIVDFIKRTFGAKPVNDIARKVVDRIEAAIRGDENIPESPTVTPPIRSGLQTLGEDEESEPEKPGGVRTNVGENYESEKEIRGNAPPVESSLSPDEARVAQGARSGGEVLRSQPSEVAREHTGSSGRIVGDQFQLRSGENESVENVVAESFSRSRSGISSDEAEGDYSSPEAARVAIEGRAIGQAGAAAGQNTRILANRILRGSYDPSAASPPARDFISHLFKKLSGLTINFRDFNRADDDPSTLAKYETGDGSISINRQLLESSPFESQTRRARWESVIGEELIHAAANRVSSREDIASVWDSLTPDERFNVRKAYDPEKKYGENGERLDAYGWGNEYIRLVLQERLMGDITESHGKYYRQTVSLQNVLRNLVKQLKDWFGAKPTDALARRVIGRIEAAIRGEPPIERSVFGGGDSIRTNIGEADDEISSEDAMPDREHFHQTAGVPDLGAEYKPERIKATQEAVRDTTFSAQGPVTKGKTSEFFRHLEEFTNPATRRNVMESLVSAVKDQTGDPTGELAPSLLYAELRDYATTLMARGEPEPLLKVIQLSNEFATNADVVSSSAGRTLRGLQEGNGKLLIKSLFAVAKANQEAAGKEMGVSKELFQQLMDALDRAKLDPGELEMAIRTGKDSSGNTIPEMLGIVPEEVHAGLEAVRRKREQAKADNDADRTAKRLLDSLQLKHGAEWLKPDAKKNRNSITEYAKAYLTSEGPNIPPEFADKEARRVATELENLGVNPKTSIFLAHELIQERETNFGNKRIAQMEAASKSKNIKSLIESIMQSPIRAQADPAWLEETARQWFMDNGLASEEAKAATRLFQKQFQAAFQKAQERIASQVLHAGKQRTLDHVIKMIRSGALDPSNPASGSFSDKIGYKGFTKAEFQKLAELEEKLSGPVRDEHGQTLRTYPEDVMRREQMLQIFAKHAPDPTFMQALASNVSVANLMGIKTMTVHMDAGVIHVLHERVLSSLSQWPTATNLKTLWRPLISASQRFIDEFRFAFGRGHSYYPIAELESAQNTLRILLDRGVQDFHSPNMATKAKGLVKILVGLQDYGMRTLNAFNQANVIFQRDAGLALYGTEAFKILKINPAEVDRILQSAQTIRQAEYDAAIDRGLTPLMARVVANDQVFHYATELFGQHPEVKNSQVGADIGKSATYPALLGVGRLAHNIGENKLESIKEEDEGGLLSRMPLGGHWLLKTANRLATDSPEGKIGKIFWIGYVGVPYRMARELAWNTAYGLLRLGIHSYREKRGLENWWKQSLATEYQVKYRLRMAIAGTAAQILVTGGALYLGKKTSADKDAGKDKFGWYVTGNGPDNKVLKDAWTRLGFQPNSLILFLNGKVHVAIPITRAGESLGHMLWGLSAADDYAWRKKIAEDSGKPFKEGLTSTALQAIGNYAWIIGERGPIQQILQVGNQERSPQMAMASVAGRLLGPVVPFEGLQRSVRDMIVGQVDYSTPLAAFEANFPILGYTGSTQAINRFGDPLYDHSWYAKMAHTGIPIAFGVNDTGPNRALYQAIVDQGITVPPLRRSELEDKYGPLTQDQWNTFARTSGATLKSDLMENLNTLQSDSPQVARKMVDRSAHVADQRTAIEMGLVSPDQVSKRAAAASQAPATHGLRPGGAGATTGLPKLKHPHPLRLHKLGHAAVLHKPHTLSSLRSHKRAFSFS